MVWQPQPAAVGHVQDWRSYVPSTAYPLTVSPNLAELDVKRSSRALRHLQFGQAWLVSGAADCQSAAMTALAIPWPQNRGSVSFVDFPRPLSYWWLHHPNPAFEWSPRCGPQCVQWRSGAVCCSQRRPPWLMSSTSAAVERCRHAHCERRWPPRESRWSICPGRRRDNPRCDSLRCDSLRCDSLRCDSLRCDSLRRDNLRRDNLRRDNLRPGSDHSGIWAAVK